MTFRLLRIAVAFLAVVFIPSTAPRIFAQPVGKYADRKISLDFRDADIRNVLTLIAGVAELNMVVAADVKGRVTIRLVHVPWDQALDVVLQSHSLGMKRMGNVLWIAPRRRLREEEETQLESERSREKLENLRTELIRLNYANAREMVPIVKNFLSDRGTVSADERTNTLIIRDASKNIEEIKGLFR